MRTLTTIGLVSLASLLSACAVSEAQQTTNDPVGILPIGQLIVDTGQIACYNARGGEITCPSQGQELYGQDAHFAAAAFAFVDNDDGTVTDTVTGLLWQKTPPSQTFGWAAAQTFCENLSLAGRDDWRAPSIKELFSISDFNSGWPYIYTNYFDIIDSPELKQNQYWGSDLYHVGPTHGDAPSAFGVNHGTGHIKAYPDGSDGSPMAGKYVRCVTGEEYMRNDFENNGDGTVTDHASGLIWSAKDSATALDWVEALALAARSNDEAYLGHDDWRVPNVKELQSIVDYSGVYPAIDSDLFTITDEDAYFWSNTSAFFSPMAPDYHYAWYVAFGKAVGPDGEDTHGAGAVRFDTKVAGGPAGEDPERIYNYVRLVRDAGE